MRRLVFSLTVVSVLPLVGCSPYQSKFDCPYGTGVGCASLSKVSTMVDRNQIDLGEDDVSADKVQPKRKVQIFYRPGTLSRLVTVPAPREL